MYDWVIQEENKLPTFGLASKSAKETKTFSEILNDVQYKEFSPHDLVNTYQHQQNINSPKVRLPNNIVQVECQSCKGHPGIFYEDFTIKRNQAFNNAKKWKATSNSSKSSRTSYCSRFSNKSRGNSRIKCFYCKKLGHTMDNCFFRNKACFQCGNRNHFIANCPYKSEARSGRSPVNSNRINRNSKLTKNNNSKEEMAASSLNC